MTERAPSKRRLSRLAKRQRRDEHIAAAPVQLGGDAIIGRDLTPSVALAQFMTRLRVEVRQVLTSPGLIVLMLLAIGLHRRSILLHRQLDLWHRGPSDRRRDHHHVAGGSTDLPADDRRFLRRRARLARTRPQGQRAHRFDRRAELGDHGSEDARHLPRAADRQPRRRADRHRLPADRGRPRDRPRRNISAGSSCRPRSTAC